MSLVHRASVALLSTALAVTLAGGGAPAQASSSSPQQQGADWLAGQLRHGLIHNGQFDFDDYGLTIDTAFALQSIGGHGTTLSHIRSALEQHAADYTTFQTDVYAGPTAKLLVFARETGGGATDFGGIDLVAQLRSLVLTSGPAKGRIQDQSSFGDFANTIGQVYAMQGLKPHTAQAAPVLNFLLDQQCSAGFFRLNFAKDATTGNQTCDGATAAHRVPDTDATAIAVLGLVASHRNRRAVHRAVNHAAAWLLKHQADNGSFGGGPTTAAANSNSTGLAGWALAVSGHCSAARQAAQWVRARQVDGQLSGTPLAGERGAIAYDNAAMKAADQDGITTETRDQWRRATAQAAPALRALTGCAGF
jgi:hypothetical protein